jgi:hypothetical protein
MMIYRTVLDDPLQNTDPGGSYPVHPVRLFFFYSKIYDNSTMMLMTTTVFMDKKTRTVHYDRLMSNNHEQASH